MSAVISRAKRHYLWALMLELCFLVVISLGIFFIQPRYSLSFLVGCLASFFPFAVFVFWFFFIDNKKNLAKMTALYRAEGLKWLTAILLIIMIFKLVKELNLFAFFAGYIVILVLNNLIPFLLSLRK